MIRRFWLVIIIGILGIAIGAFLSYKIMQKSSNKHVDEQVTVLLEKVKKVSKLITVEGHFSELYSYKDYYTYDWWPLRKKAVIRVNARVSVGLDLENLEIKADTANRVLNVIYRGYPEILSLETDMDYYDLSEGVFNSFKSEDLTAIQQRAKTYIRQKVMESDLPNQAIEQSNDIFLAMQSIVELAGWKMDLDFQFEIPTLKN
jgi:hypothetical protein